MMHGATCSEHMASLERWQKQLLISTIVNVAVALGIIGVGVLYIRLIEDGIWDAKHSNNALVRYLAIKADATYSYQEVNRIYPVIFIAIGVAIFAASFVGAYGILREKAYCKVAFLTTIIAAILANVTTILVVFLHFYPVKRNWRDSGVDLHNVIETLVECCGFDSVYTSRNCRYSEPCGDKIFGQIVSRSWLVMFVQGTMTIVLFVNTVWMSFIIRFIHLDLPGKDSLHNGAPANERTGSQPPALYSE